MENIDELKPQSQGDALLRTGIHSPFSGHGALQVGAENESSPSNVPKEGKGKLSPIPANKFI